MPEKTESALDSSIHVQRLWISSAYLGSTISGKGVVPKSFVRTSNWNLVLMVTVCKCTGSQEGDSEDVT
jgi:hypothetical protein